MRLRTGETYLVLTSFKARGPIPGGLLRAIYPMPGDYVRVIGFLGSETHFSLFAPDRQRLHGNLVAATKVITRSVVAQHHAKSFRRNPVATNEEGDFLKGRRIQVQRGIGLDMISRHDGGKPEYVCGDTLTDAASLEVEEEAHREHRRRKLYENPTARNERGQHIEGRRITVDPSPPYDSVVSRHSSFAGPDQYRFTESDELADTPTGLRPLSQRRNPAYESRHVGDKKIINLRMDMSDLEIIKALVAGKFIAKSAIAALKKKQIFVDRKGEQFTIIDSKDPMGMPILELQKKQSPSVLRSKLFSMRAQRPAPEGRLSPREREDIKRALDAGDTEGAADIYGASAEDYLLSQAEMMPEERDYYRRRARRPNPPEGAVAERVLIAREMKAIHFADGSLTGGLGKAWGLEDGSAFVEYAGALPQDLGFVKSVEYIDEHKALQYKTVCPEDKNSNRTVWIHDFKPANAKAYPCERGFVLKGIMRLWEIIVYEVDK